MTHTEPSMPLFDSSPQMPSRSVKSSIPRKAQRDRAGQKADPIFLAEYERLLKVYASVIGSFVAADVTAFYEERKGKISETNAKGLGSLFGDLQRRGVIEKTGEWKPRKNGNASLEYRLKR